MAAQGRPNNLPTLLRNTSSLPSERILDGFFNGICAIVATKASAVSWPTPEKVISRRQAAGALAMRRMFESIAATALITVLRVAIPHRGEETRSL
jgi:hypothetical protein